MLPQSHETLIIAGNEFNLSVSLLPSYLLAKKMQLDEGKDFTAAWELNLKNNYLYLKSCNASIGGKEVTLNDLFPDLFSTPSPIKTYWLIKKIEVELRKTRTLIDYLVIQVSKGYVSNFYHKQIVTDKTSNEVLSEIEKEITQERFVELIDLIPKMDWFTHGIYCYTAEGLGRNEIAEKLFPRDLYYNKLNSITIRFLELIRKHSDYFMPVLCYFYPFTREMLRKHQEWLNKNQWGYLSENWFLDWNENLLMEFKDKWDWNRIGTEIIGIRGELKSFDFMLKYYEMGLIDAEDIVMNELRCYDCSVYSDVNSFYDEFDEIFQLVSRNKKLYKEINELVREEIKREKYMKEESFLDEWILMNETESQSNTPVKIGSLVEGSYEQIKYENYLNQPKELEQIISFLERNGNILEDKVLLSLLFVSKHLEWNGVPDPFLFYNPLENGIDYTFNTPQKKKILDDAVMAFLDEQPMINRINRSMDFIQDRELVLQSKLDENVN